MYAYLLAKPIMKLNKQVEELYKKYIWLRNQYDEFQYEHQQQSNVLESKFKNVRFSKKLSKNINYELRILMYQ
ncbi:MULTISPECIES: hypothetical protein [unclassified Clostridioides]|uniref:hypothetical protein n=1 Tax=unclassified Clostridioides TaxID=2635829 RepID=UPI001D121216|nr:hypothetical protein [Clostridioides sp. ZZV15-6388]MCC0644104.1 hypothetical protein [Clostridioides sp. ZZV14-6150]MCC0660991.1 hypothetical protein [Clostridioides sp. ZZV14-6154]MCC0664331.1 hypothetical protein [Clostridioides sp. ZZV15-6597]MCC0668293.1 hypothetical protein [Clostridioides sp. ZZV14-6153]MCC0720241.1 hypothetical protein [Clostridioides sp. ZZV14-6105]MCC0722588.1 hypothetical protein [Clostridioides sp. ZZV14-6104]MCC0727098.1 hypothetical protein [Clostridioides s